MHNGLDGDLYRKLKTIVIYLVSLYFPMFLFIKVKNNFLEGPRHVLQELELFRLQSAEVQDLLNPTLRRSAWNAHSESVLLCMLTSEVLEERIFAVDKILKIRGKKKEGDSRPRARKHPDL